MMARSSDAISPSGSGLASVVMAPCSASSTPSGRLRAASSSRDFKSWNTDSTIGPEGPAAAATAISLSQSRTLAASRNPPISVPEPASLDRAAPSSSNR
jgi:hypothetical protein